MDPADAISALAPLIYAIEQARLSEKLCKILNGVQRVDETSEQALIRLVQERYAIAQILASNGINHDRFDDTYRNNDITNDIWVLIQKIRKSSGQR